MRRFEEQVKQNLKAMRITQNALAKQMEFSHSYINKFLNGHRDGSVQFVTRLSDITGVPLESLKEQ